MSQEITTLEKSISIIVVLFVLSVFGAVMFRMTCVSFTDNYELAYEYNQFTGEIKVLEGSGYWVRNPFKYKIHSIDLRPLQVQINANVGANGGTYSSINQRVLNAKLVKFNPEGFDTFMKWHGRDAGSSRSELSQILMCYAFDRDDGSDCPFLTVISQLSPSQSIPESKKSVK